MIEILIVSQLPTLHSESSSMFQGRLAILSREKGEIRDPVTPWVGVFPIYHIWIRFVELRAANLLKGLAHIILVPPLRLPLNLVLQLVAQKVVEELVKLTKEHEELLVLVVPNCHLLL